jgi:hypothetical protein
MKLRGNNPSEKPDFRCPNASSSKGGGDLKDLKTILFLLRFLPYQMFFPQKSVLSILHEQKILAINGYGIVLYS